MMVHHDFVRIDFGRAELVGIFCDLKKIAAHAVARSDINKTIVVNGRRNYCGLTPARSAPEELAVIGADTSNGAGGELNVLPHSPDFSQKGRGVVGQVSPIFAAP